MLGHFRLVRARAGVCVLQVWIDLAVDRTARKHARGEKVPVATGGERVRCRVGLADGTGVTATYNTRVTSEVG